MKTSAPIPIMSENENTASAAIPIIIPVDPIISSGFLPNLSTVNMATRVNMMFTMPITTVWTMEASPLAPRFSNILGA